MRIDSDRGFSSFGEALLGLCLWCPADHPVLVCAARSLRHLHSISLVVGEGTLKLILEDGKEEVLTYKNSRDGQNPALATYSFSPPDNKTYEVYHHFCSKCGVHVFLTGE
jgi:hypothetical protein